MSKARNSLTATVAALFFVGCASTADPIEGYEQVQPASPSNPTGLATGYPAGQVERGLYLADLLGCGSCHTDGALAGNPVAERSLAGSRTGIAISSPMQKRYPGVLYPSNLTPDSKTGIGNWSLEEIVTFLQSGEDHRGDQSLPVMPWPNYSRLTQDDATAIAMYLMSLAPVKHKVPSNVRPGTPAEAPFVHFGVYRSLK